MYQKYVFYIYIYFCMAFQVTNVTWSLMVLVLSDYNMNYMFNTAVHHSDFV